MTSRRPQWCDNFGNVFWDELCIIVANVPRSVRLPGGTGVMLEQEPRFHLSLLTRRIWARDNFWYLAFLPCDSDLASDALFRPLSYSFKRFPIEAMSTKQYRLQPDIAEVWLRLQFNLVATYNTLKEHFMPYAPLQTTMPPYPQDTGFADIYSDERGARRAAHRGRQIFLAWMCLVTATIAASARFGKETPPLWFQVLASAGKRFPPIWLDNIQRSAFLTCFESSVPRRGLVVNMSVEWSFWSCFPWFEDAGVPVWACFPHGEKRHYRLANALYPSAARIEAAKGFALVNDPILDPFDSGLWSYGTNIIPSLTTCEDCIEDVDVGFSQPTGPLAIVDECIAESSSVNSANTFHVGVEGIASIFAYRYGLKWTTTVEGSQQSMGAYLATTEVRSLLRAMVEEEAIDEFGCLPPQLADVAIAFFAATLARSRVPLNISDCHMSDREFYRVHCDSPLQVDKVALQAAVKMPYCLQTVDSQVIGYSISVSTQVTVREIIRRRWGPGNAQVLQALLSRGIPFAMLWTVTPPAVYVEPALLCIPDRPADYQFTEKDYKMYLERRLALLEDPAIARAALRKGGITWRLALDSGINATAVFGVDSCDPADGQTGRSFSECALTQESIDVLVGVYRVYTGKGEQVSMVSWWPNEHAWLTGGMNCGYWSSQCEGWFVRRHEGIMTGKFSPRKAKQWQSSLRGHLPATRALLREMERSIDED